MEFFKGWIWDKNESSWQEGTLQLLNTQKKGDASPTAKYQNNEGYLLGGLVKRQRYNWKNLSEEKKELLKRLKKCKQKIRKTWVFQ